MQIKFTSTLGGGFADVIEVNDGITLGELFRQKTGNGNFNDYSIFVNRQAEPSSYRVQEGDRVSIAPRKIKGAAA